MVQSDTATEPQVRELAGADAALFLLEYSDGFTAAMLHGAFSGWAYAAREDGEMVGTAFNGNESPNYPPFSYLGLNIQNMFITKRAPWPVELAMGGKVICVPPCIVP